MSSQGLVYSRVTHTQQKTGSDVQFEITARTLQSLNRWLHDAQLQSHDYLFPSARRSTQPISYSHYRKIIKAWAKQLGLDEQSYGTHSMRRTKATLIYAKTKNIRAVQLLLGQTKVDNTIRHLGMEIEDAIKISEDTDSLPVLVLDHYSNAFTSNKSFNQLINLNTHDIIGKSAAEFGVEYTKSEGCIFWPKWITNSSPVSALLSPLIY